MSTFSITPYLALGGQAEEAIEFYKSALGAEVQMMMRFADSPEPMPGLPDDYGQKVMHATLNIGGAAVMLSDGCGEAAEFKGITLAITVKSVAEAESAFAALSDGGAVTMPLAKTFWSPMFGMVKDRFGVDWMVDTEDASATA